MNFRQKVHIPSHIYIQAIDDEMVLLDTQSENYFGLDGMGTVMWEQLSVSPSLEDLAEYMLKTYDVEEDVLHADITTFIDKLVKNKLITLGEL